ncbi:hypothetical protein FRX31_012631, partial [Thalictrum thalictroides]
MDSPEHASIHLNQFLHYLPNVSIGGGTDEVVWNVTLSGEFALKDTYEALRKTTQPVEWSRII